MLAWRIIPHLPPRLVDGVAGLVGRLVATLNVPSVRQLRKNLQSLTGEQPSSRQVSNAVASYFRCFGQQFSLPGWSEAYLRSGCTYALGPQVEQLMKQGPVVLALTHSGNWDLAGAWFCATYGPIVTVAEKLDPPELFEGFTKYRESLGMEIIGVGPGESVFEQLVESTRGRSVLVPLLADRDISGSGVKVRLGESDALVAAGPAALALRLGRPLIAGHITYVKKDGRWGIRIHTTEPIEPPVPSPGESQVEALTREWVRQVVPLMKAGDTDWHMMQRLFVNDLDPKRLARAEQRHKEASARLEAK